MFKTIILAYDGSTASERVLLYAGHMARLEGVEIIVVHGYEVPTVYEWADGYTALEAQMDALATEVVEDAVQALRRAGVKAMADIRRGPAAQVILEAVTFHQADLIVMGGRAQQAENVGETLLGSVSSTVLRFTNCPVLVVP